MAKNYLHNVFFKLLINIESIWRCGNNEQTSQLTLLYWGRTVRSSHQSCSIKKLFLKVSQYLLENTCVGVSFNKVVSLQIRNFFKKRFQHKVFPVDISKLFRLAISKKICEQLLLHCFNGSMLHRPKGSRFILRGSIRLQGLSHRFSFFVFKLASLVLNWTLSCVLKPTTNTFDEWIKFLDWLFFGCFRWFQVVLDGFRSF